MKTPEELKQIWEHLDYEIAMFRNTAFVIHHELRNETFLANVFIESFVLHTRNLINFFFGGENGDDVIASQFVSPPEQWRNSRGKMPKILSDVKFRAGKHLAHLTWTRTQIQAKEREWEITEIARAMEEVIDAFEKEVSRGPVQRSQPLQTMPPLTAENIKYKTVVGTTSPAAFFGSVTIGPSGSVGKGERR